MLGTSVGGGLLQGDTANEERILHATSGKFLRTDRVLVRVVLVEAEGRTHRHRRAPRRGSVLTALMSERI